MGIMRAVFVYPIILEDVPYQKFDVETSLHAKPLTFVKRGIRFCLYVEEGTKTVSRQHLTFVVVKSGHDIGDYGKYFQTVVDGDLIWHIYWID